MKKNKWFYRVLTLMLAMLMIFGMAACGDDDYVEDEPSNKKQSSSTKETESKSTEPTETTENTEVPTEAPTEAPTEPPIDKEAVKQEAMAAADLQAMAGDYLGAISTIDQAVVTIGEDADLAAKKVGYEKFYLASILDNARAKKKAKDYEGALEALNQGFEYFPGDASLTAEIAEVEAAKAKTAEIATANPNQNPVAPKAAADVVLTGGASMAAATTVQREDVNHASFTTENQVDWFRFTTSSNYSAYCIHLLNNSVDGPVYITLYDAYEKELAHTESGYGDAGYIDITLAPNTEYFVKFYRFYNDHSGNYQFTVNEKICDAGVDKAGAFYVDLDVQNIKSQESRYIDDWFRFTTTNSYATYQFSLTNNSIDSSLYLTVYDTFDTKLGEIHAYAGETTLLDLALDANKDYWIKVTPYYGDKAGFYQFSISEMYCDGGKTKEQAMNLALGMPYNKAADTSLEEWFCYTFTETGTYTLTFTNNNIDTALYANVYDVLGTDLGRLQANNSKTEEHSMEIAAGTVLYIKITRYDKWRFGNYTLQVTQTPT